MINHILFFSIANMLMILVMGIVNHHLQTPKTRRSMNLLSLRFWYQSQSHNAIELRHLKSLIDQQPYDICVHVYCVHNENDIFLQFHYVFFVDTRWLHGKQHIIKIFGVCESKNHICLYRYHIKIKYKISDISSGVIIYFKIILEETNITDDIIVTIVK